MNPNEYAISVIDAFVKNITDYVFLNIQNNENLMREYQMMVDDNSPETINQAIGKKVKEMLDLENDGTCSTPKSRLIKSYTYHKSKHSFSAL